MIDNMSNPRHRTFHVLLGVGSLVDMGAVAYRRRAPMAVPASDLGADRAKLNGDRVAIERDYRVAVEQVTASRG